MKNTCVNALNGLLSFLLRRTYREYLGSPEGVNALNGLLSFLHGGKQDGNNETN